MFGTGRRTSLLVKDYSDGGVRLQLNRFEIPDDFALLLAPNEPARSGRYRWFGAWEGTWALNLLALRPSPADTMPRRDSAESSGAFWPFCAIATQPARARTNPRASLSQWMWSWIMIVTAPTVTATAAIPIRMVLPCQSGQDHAWESSFSMASSLPTVCSARCAASSLDAANGTGQSNFLQLSNREKFKKKPNLIFGVVVEDGCVKCWQVNGHQTLDKP